MGKCIATYKSDKSDLRLEFQPQTLTLNYASAPVRGEPTGGGVRCDLYKRQIKFEA
jgi:hypothetical protein